jgi:hypothetical protein
MGFREEGAQISAHLRGPGDREEQCSASFLAGCDGAKSLVRQTLGAGFPGGTYQQLFYVADVEASGPAINGELHVDLDDADFLALFPLAPAVHVRLIGTVRDERAEHPEALRFGDVSDRAIQNLQVKVEKVNWFSTYRVHHRVAEHFRKGRAFLLGDAAHIHSPVGGQGMNTGIGDAINLAWKLAAVLAGQAPDSLLDTYEPERIEFARKLVATTDRAFTLITAEGRLADILRTRIAPTVMSKLVGFEFARDFLFRTVSQITLSYRNGPLSEGKVGDVHGGDRLPWAEKAGNFESLSRMTWQIHVYGEARADLAQWCQGQRLALQQFAWQDGYREAGLTRDALYLLRPDTYVALTASVQDPNLVAQYLARQGIRTGPPAP